MSREQDLIDTAARYRTAWHLPADTPIHVPLVDCLACDYDWPMLRGHHVFRSDPPPLKDTL